MHWTGLVLAMLTLSEPAATAPAAGGRWGAPAEPAPLERRAAGQGPAAAAAPGTCTAFADPDFGGAALSVRDGQPLEWVGRAWDNRLSSVACAPGCRFLAFQHINYGGPRASFAGAFARLGEVFDNRISAARVTCGAEHH